MAYVYAHFKKDSGEIFYVGIGKSDDGKNGRAYDKNKRSKFWKSITQRHGFYATIMYDSISWSDAIKFEIELIKTFGRSNNGTGVLCNLTDGGEGCFGFVITDEYRKNCSNAQKGKIGRFGSDNPFYGKKHSKESLIKKSETTKRNGKLKGVNNPNYGKPMSDEQKQKIRMAHIGRKHTQESSEKKRAWAIGRPKTEEWKAKVRGDKNGMVKYGHLYMGDKSPTAKKCVLITTGETFGCLKSACATNGLSYNTELAYIKPHHPRHKNRKFNYL